MYVTVTTALFAFSSKLKDHGNSRLKSYIPPKLQIHAWTMAEARDSGLVLIMLVWGVQGDHNLVTVPASCLTCLLAHTRSMR